MSGRAEKPQPAAERVSLGTRSIDGGRRVGVSAPQRPGTEAADPAEASAGAPESRDPEGRAHGS